MIINSGLRATKGTVRTKSAARENLEHATNGELKTFRHPQDLFTHGSILTHFTVGRILYIDINASKEFGFDVMVA